MLVRPFITTYERPELLAKVLRTLSSQFDEIVLLDNSVVSSVCSAALSSTSRSDIIYLKTGKNIGFVRNLSEGICSFYSDSRRHSAIFDFLCGGDSWYSSQVGSVLRDIGKFALSCHPCDVPNAVILGHSNYGDRLFNLKQSVKRLLAKPTTMHPSGASPIGLSFLEKICTCVYSNKHEKLWKITGQNNLCHLLVYNGMPRYIGLAYNHSFLISWLS